MKFFKWLSLAVVCLLIGTAIGYHWVFVRQTSCAKTYGYLNKDVGCGRELVLNKKSYAALVAKLNEYFAEQKSENKLTKVGVYFRDLNNGPTFGMSVNEVFVPASLMKLPLLLTYLNLADHDPTILEQRLIYSATTSALSQTIKPEEEIQTGTPYTVDELLSRMIIYSDNKAFDLLIGYQQSLSPQATPLFDTLRNLGLIWGKNYDEPTLSAQEYASIFRLLYNASFLSPESSQKALTLLAQSEFKDGLVAGVPHGIVVAHKFGERVGLPDGERQLHDCGIVYYPKNPYILCVMTRGYDLTELAQVISHVSEAVFKEVESREL